MATTRQAMDAFLESVTPTAWQSDTLIPVRKKSVVENLTSSFPSTSDMPFMRADLIGSAAKGTIIRPIDDIDVMAVFSNVNKAWGKYQYDSKSFLYRIRKAYDGCLVQQVGARGQAVRVFFKTGGHVDVAPMFWLDGDDYWLPNGTGGWIKTAPLKATKWFKTINGDDKHRQNVAPLVCLLKSWNRAHSKRFRSYHLETLAAVAFNSLGSNYREALSIFFDWASRNIYVQDPGGHSGNLSSYMNWTQQQDAIKALQRAYEQSTRALAAEADGDHAEATRLWKIILGDGFPTA